MPTKERLLSLRAKLAKAAGSEKLESLARSSVDKNNEITVDVIRFGDETDLLTKARNGDFDNFTTDEGTRLEAIVEREFRQVSFVKGNTFEDLPFPWEHFNQDPVRSRLNAVIPSIGRVELISPGGVRTELVGTGFLVGEGLLMTNRHVAEVFVRGAGSQRLFFRPGRAAIDFGREPPLTSSVLSSTLKFKGVRMVHPFWDMALFELERQPQGVKPLPLSVLTPEELKDREIATVGYPGPGKDLSDEAQKLESANFNGIYGVKRLAPGVIDGRGNILSFKHLVPAMAHDCSTLPGNSGSAIIDVSTGHVVGLHFKGITLEANFSVPLFELARDKRVIDAGVLFTGNVSTTTEWEPWWENPAHLESAALLVKPPAVKVPGFTAAKDAGNNAPAGGIVTSLPAEAAGVGGAAVWTVPIIVSVSIGFPVAGAAAAGISAGAAGQEESFQIPVMYGGMDEREGYDPAFLELPGGEKVPLPELTEQGRAAAAVQANGESELKYHHFSIVMHKKRRLALFTAANVDWRKDSREPGGRKFTRAQLSEIPEGVQEQWVLDDRIPEDQQLPDIFYTKDRKSFDKGHLVRRDDMAWGTSFEDIQMANGDTYFTTNCSPQVLGYNRSAKGEFNWGDLENMVQQQAKKEKVIIFSGPVLRAQDRYFPGLTHTGPARVQVPRHFWKIIVAKTDDGVKAFGFMPEQDLSNVDWQAEMALPEAWRKHAVKISEIEKKLFGLVKLNWCKAHDALG